MFPARSVLLFGVVQLQLDPKPIPERALTRQVSAFDIERFADSITLISNCDDLNRKGSLWPRETTI